MYRRLFSIIAIGLSLSACVPYYPGATGYYRSEVYTAPAPYYYGGYRPYYVYPRSYDAPPPYVYRPSRVYRESRYYQGPRDYYPRDYYQRRGHRSGHGPGWWGR